MAKTNTALTLGLFGIALGFWCIGCADVAVPYDNDGAYDDLSDQCVITEADDGFLEMECPVDAFPSDEAADAGEPEDEVGVTKQALSGDPPIYVDGHGTRWCCVLLQNGRCIYVPCGPRSL